MRRIFEERLYLDFRGETSLKVVQEYRAKYAWIDQCLEANPLILWLAHEDLEDLSLSQKGGCSLIPDGHDAIDVAPDELRSAVPIKVVAEKLPEGPLDRLLLYGKAATRRHAALRCRPRRPIRLAQLCIGKGAASAQDGKHGTKMRGARRRERSSAPRSTPR